MGIRCYCPNGHKLNIKAFQAGLRGVCPRCGESFAIPRHSTRRSAKRHEEADASSAPAEMVEGGDDEVGSANPAVAAADQEMEISLRTVEQEQSPSALRYPSPPEPPELPEPVSEVSEKVDPIEENPRAIWYVRPPSGGQYGPADGEVMRQWLDEGRISVNSLVWCEGWEQWEEAMQVFPQLNPEAGTAAAPATSSIPRTGVIKPLQRETSVEEVIAPPATVGGGWLWIGVGAVAIVAAAAVAAVCFLF